jgi:hypothetical protein
MGVENRKSGWRKRERLEWRKITGGQDEERDRGVRM